MEQRRITGMPHAIYRYPARFSPEFAREAILRFSDMGELVLDPFSGGGTAITEAIALGRRAAGIDISALATFLSRAKTTPLSVHDVKTISDWAERLPTKSDFKTKAASGSQSERSSIRHLNCGAQKFFQGLLPQVRRLTKARQQRFARLILLGIGQAALDCKIDAPTVDELLDEFHRTLESALIEFRRFWSHAAEAHAVPPCQLTRFRRILNRSATGCELDKRIPREWLPAKLILTSPPYPGVHVLYHRWQVHGRRETPAAFWITNQLDGAGESYYTFGWRQQEGLSKYFGHLRSTFTSVRALVGYRSLVVQLVGFSKPELQLPLYLTKMKEAGFEEVMPQCDRSALYHGRIWRNVPSRRWYASIDPRTNSSREVLLLHRPIY